MGQCKHHPQSATGEGVCPSCLQKKLKTVRWSDTGCSAVAEKPPTRDTTLDLTLAVISKPKPSVVDPIREPVPPKEAMAILGSIASITKRNVHRGSKGRDITEAGLDFVLDSRYTDNVRVSMPGFLCPPSKVVMSQNADESHKEWKQSRSKVTPTLANSRSRSPLVDTVAKETALRVIREVKEDISAEAADGVPDVNPGNANKECEKARGFSPSRWQSSIRSKWGLKGIGTPNKVFPSKSVENVQKSLLQTHFVSSPGRDQSRVDTVSPPGGDQQQAGNDRGTQPAGEPTAEPTQEMVIVGMPDRILKPEDMNQRLKASHHTVLHWLEDLPVPETLLLQQIGDPDEDPYSMDILNYEAYGLHGLAVVGRLHEIAEEHEILDEEEAAPELSTGNHLSEVSSFGKFLIRAAQRQPKEGLSRVQARATALVLP